jgi:cell shape-determining protein MreD
MKRLGLILAVLVVAALQSRLPVLWGLRIELLPPLVAAAALRLRRGHALMAAVVAGLAQDALSAAPFGPAAVAFAAAALLLGGMRETLDPELPWVQMAAGAVVCTAGCVAGCLAAGFSLVALVKIVLLAGLSAVLTPVWLLAWDSLQMFWRRA